MKKALIIVAVVFVVMGVMATAGLLYVGYRVRNRIEREAAALRHDTSRPAPVTVAAAAEATGRRVDACSLLSKEEASQILGVAVERTQAKEASGQSTCQYFAKPRSQQEKMASVANAFGAIAKGGATPDLELTYEFFLETEGGPRQAGRPVTLKHQTSESLAYSLPLLGWPEGSYQVRVRVTDNRTAAKAEGQGAFRVVR